MAQVLGLPHELPADTAAFFRRTFRLLKAGDVPFVIGGAFAFEHYTDILRPTKDADVFVRQADLDRALDALSAGGYGVEPAYPHWLAKAYDGDRFVDLIFRSGNGVTEVDDAWLSLGPLGEVLGEEVRLCPPEELLVTKAFIFERERCDMADVLHLILTVGPRLDWRRVLDRFGAHWRVLLAHLVLFEYVYPGERSRVPRPVVEALLDREAREQAAAAPEGRLCRGTLLSRAQFLVDVDRWGYHDARLEPENPMTPWDIRWWTEDADEAVRTR
jgi:hypothetical protein